MAVHGHIIHKTFKDFEVKHLYSLELNTAFVFKVYCLTFFIYKYELLIIIKTF